MAIWDNWTQRSTQTLSPLSKAQQERAALFALYWNYYRGRHRKPLKVKQLQADDNVIINLCRRVVDKSVAFLFGLPVEWDSDELPDGARDYIATVLGSDEQRHMLLQEMAINGSICGTCFVRVYAGDVPRVVVLNPAQVDVITNEDDIEDVVSYRLTWQGANGWKRHRIDLQDNGQWLITEERQVRNVDVWEIVNEEVWPYTWAPIFWCQNRPNPTDVWGISDLEDADINDTVNFIASNAHRIIRYHAHPRTIGIGFAAAQIQAAAVDDFWAIPDKDAKVFNLEMQGDLAATFNYLAMLRNVFSKTTGVPELDPAQVNIGALSGFALRILYGDLIEMTSIKRNTYGEMLSMLISALLEMGGFGKGLRVELRWQDAIPADPGAQAQLLALDRAQGVSLETYLSARGYDVEQELERIQAERATNTTLGEALLGAFERGALNA